MGISFKMKMPSVTLSDKDRGAIAGMALGGPVGAAVGYSQGGKIGNWLQHSVWDNLTGKNQKLANQYAMENADTLRRNNIVKEYGAKQQADSLAFAGLNNRNGNSGGGANTSPGVVGKGGAGFIGQGVSGTSGTF